MPFSSSSWRELKDQGRDEYEKGHYEEALRLYEQAKSSCSNRLDRQMLLSNIVACRLNLGQNQQALIDAKECVRLNPSWSKGHVRLASAYIANHASNDACNALQTALRHDPSNATARQMLLQQLQRDRREPMNNDNSDRRTTASSSSGPDPVPSTQTHNPRNHDVLDDAISWNDRIHATIGRWNRWYTSQSEHRRTGFKVLLAMILIYVSFGGRFGLGSSSLAEPLSYHPEDPYSGSRRRRNEDSRYYDDAPRQRDHYDASFDSEDSYRRQNRYSYGYDSYRSSSSRRQQQQPIVWW